jgi:uncharacterized protein YdbL (DUF1318 family)
LIELAKEKIMKTVFKYIVVSVLFLAFMSGAAVQAAGVKDRMKARLPEIIALKAQGVVGENNRGYLEFIGTKVKEALVKAENSDRKKVYMAIAGQQGASLEIVEKRRAAQIASKGRPGEWFQDPGGKWYKK